MTSVPGSLTFDCANPRLLAAFWSGVTGWPVDEPDDGDEIALTPPPGHPMMLFIRVPEAKSAKNRLHLDIVPQDGATRDDETGRLRRLGATLVADHRRPDGRGWVVLADPEGNEFCVERGDAERAAPPV
jgi:hypothetical protein